MNLTISFLFETAPSSSALIRAMLNDDENARATLQRVMDHPWTNTDFGRVIESFK